LAVAFCRRSVLVSFFYDTTSTEIYTLSLHDALPISDMVGKNRAYGVAGQGAALAAPVRVTQESIMGLVVKGQAAAIAASPHPARSEEHTSELQSRENLVCRLLLEKKKE